MRFGGGSAGCLAPANRNQSRPALLKYLSWPARAGFTQTEIRDRRDGLESGVNEQPHPCSVNETRRASLAAFRFSGGIARISRRFPFGLERPFPLRVFSGGAFGLQRCFTFCLLLSFGLTGSIFSHFRSANIPARLAVGGPHRSLRQPSRQRGVRRGSAKLFQCRLPGPGGSLSPCRQVRLLETTHLRLLSFHPLKPRSVYVRPRAASMRKSPVSVASTPRRRRQTAGINNGLWSGPGPGTSARSVQRILPAKAPRPALDPQW